MGGGGPGDPEGGGGGGLVGGGVTARNIDRGSSVANCMNSGLKFHVIDRGGKF